MVKSSEASWPSLLAVSSIENRDTQSVVEHKEAWNMFLILLYNEQL